MNEPPDASLKQCAGPCQQFLPATPEFFHRNKNHKHGLQTLCKVCMREYKKQHYQAHKAEIDAKNKAYEETHKGQVKERKKRYAEAHKEHIQDYHKQYYADRKDNWVETGRKRYNLYGEQIRARVRQYNKTEQGRRVHRAHWHRYRAQKRASQDHYTSQQLQEQFQRQCGKCYYCKQKLGKIYHVDHVIPLSRGGSNDISNIVVACPTCNMRKAAKLPHEWPEGNRLL